MLFAVSIENLKILKYLFSKRTLALSIICTECENGVEKIFKGKEWTDILNILGLI